MFQASDVHTSTIRLVIVARHRLDGDALAALFSARIDFRVICTTTSVAVAALVGGHRRPDVVLLDAALLGNDQAQGLNEVVAQLSPTPILVLDDDLNNGRLAAVLAERNMGYFTRCTPFSELADGTRRLAHGERAFDPQIGSRLHETPRGWQLRRDTTGSDIGRLTPRELEVLKLIAQGNSVKDCAERMALAPSTVDNHKSRLMKKLGVHKSLELTRLAIREGLVSV